MENSNFYHESDLDFLNQSLNIIQKGKSQVVCLYGDHGMGKTTIVKEFTRNLPETTQTLFHFNPAVKEENDYEFLYNIFFSLWNNTSNTSIQMVKEYFYKHTGNEIAILDQEFQIGSDSPIYQYYFQLIPEILKDFIFIANQKSNMVIVFENIELYGEKTRTWLDELIKGLNHPILLIVSTSRKKIAESLPANVQMWTVKPLNVINCEKFIQPLVYDNQINAKLITNYIYIKSNGNPAFIKAIVTLWFGNKDLYKDNLLQSNKLNSNEIPLDWESLWNWYFSDEKDITSLLYFYFFRRNEDIQFWKKIFKSKKLETQFEQYLKDQILVRNKSLDKTYISFYHPSLEEYFRFTTTEERIEEFLENQLDKSFIKKHLGYINMNPYLLNMLSDNLKISGILKIIHSMAEHFKINEVVHILNGILLLPDFNSLSVTDRKQIFQALAEAYERQGKLENSLLHWQHVRDLSKRNSGEEIRTQLHIAQLLIKMDRIEEATYILKHLQNMQGLKDALKAQIFYVFGTIYYQNIQHEKAIKYFEDGLKIINEISDQNSIKSLQAKILMKLASVYNSLGKVERALKNLASAQQIYIELQEFSQSLKISLLKSYVWFNYFSKRDALRCILREYRKIRKFYAPGILEILEKQIAELYWLIGKWRYARQYYSRLFQFFRWRGDLYNASFMIGNMATIAKEIGEMGEAIQLEENALRLEHLSQNVLAMVYTYLNLGHLYLMLGAYYPAQEQFGKALHLADKNELLSEKIQAHLLIAYLHLKQSSFERAKEELKNAKTLIDMIDDDWGWINYLFYKAYLMIETENFSEAEALLQLFMKRTAHLVKYQCTGNFQMGIFYKKQGKLNDALKKFEDSLQISQEYSMPYWQYQIAYYLSEVLEDLGQGVESEKSLQSALNAIIKISNSLKDKILETQFLESRDVMQVLDAIKRIPQLNLKFIQWQIEKKEQ
ncbi:MAG: hypothetical protein Kow00108_07930 [Calditrichia bacterium]